MGKCGWHEDGSEWETDCGQVFTLFDGTPASNGMIYCCFCGNRIEEFEEEKQEC